MRVHATQQGVRRPAGRARLLGVLLVAMCCGCTESQLDTYYGRRQLQMSGASVNGTDVLASMFTAAGHTVSFRRALLTNGMSTVNTIVWVPNDEGAPSEEVIAWFDRWLGEEQGRTLIYVGRDYDAAEVYWRTMIPRVSPEQRTLYEKEAREAGEPSRFSFGKAQEFDCAWFHTVKEKREPVTELAGPWAKDISVDKAELTLGNWLQPEGAAERLLTSGKRVLVARMERPLWDESGILLVANGSFLLNLPLVNHEHRKLADRVVRSVEPGGRVIFLESGRGGVPIDPRDDGSLWQVFGAWPLNAILLQLAVVGILFCFARWPIFGRPRIPPPPSTADFRKHVSAVGELLARTRDRTFAQAQMPGAGDNTAPRAGPPKP